MGCFSTEDSEKANGPRVKCTYITSMHILFVGQNQLRDDERNA
jgi:hypothetical protein